MDVFGIEREQELDFQGVYRIPAGGGELELAVAEDDFELPNGLCFSPDESLLYINDTPRVIRVFDVAADGTLAQRRVFFDGIGTGVIAEGIADGMKCDERGNIWVTGPGGVWIISAATASTSDVLEVPETRGNLKWGGPNWRVLYIPSLDVRLPHPRRRWRPQPPSLPPLRRRPMAEADPLRIDPKRPR